MLLALLLAAATPPVEQERISDNLHRLALPAAGVATVAEGQAALLAEALVSAGREREASEIATALDRSRWQSPRTRRVTALLRQSR